MPAIAGLPPPASPQPSRGVLVGTVTDISGAVIAGAQVLLTHTETGVIRFCKITSVAASLLFFGSFLSALAQTNTTLLTGEVQDTTGAAIAGSTVTLTNPQTGLTQTTQSGAAGQYIFSQISPGKYTVTVRSQGFSQQTQTVELLVATPLRIAFKLSAAGASEVVTVETSLATINSDDGTLGKAFNSAQVSSLPYLANNVTYLLSLQPGVLALDPGATTGGLLQSHGAA